MRRELLPREHGAYGQVSFPALTALLVAGASLPGVCLTAAVFAGFLAHEPVHVLLGTRGLRASRELGASARRYLAGLVVVVLSAGGVAAIQMPATTRWTLAVPLFFTVPMGLAIAARSERTVGGEVVSAIAAAACALPVASAAGRELSLGLSVALAYAATFALSTLAVHVVILGVRAGGAHRRQRMLRALVLMLGVALLPASELLLRAHLVERAAQVAIIPAVLFAAALVVRPPHPARLRQVGWGLVAMTATVAAILVAGLA